MILWQRKYKYGIYEKEKKNDFQIRKKEWFHEKEKWNDFIRRKTKGMILWEEKKARILLEVKMNDFCMKEKKQ